MMMIGTFMKGNTVHRATTTLCTFLYKKILHINPVLYIYKYIVIKRLLNFQYNMGII